MYVKYTWDRPDLWLRYAWDMPEICLRYPWNTQEIPMRYPLDSLGAPSTGGFPQCWGNYIFQSWGISPVLGKCVLQFSEISAFIQKKSWIKPNEWNIFIIFITFWTQKKNYSFLASLLNCQKLKRKKHISPALGKSPRIEKCHFPSTGEIPQCWEPLDCYRHWQMKKRY